MKKINKKGFTLIELLVVIAIIGLLSTLAVVSLNNARSKSRDAKRISDIKQIQTALELYYTDNDGYPNTTEFAEGGPIDDVETTFMGTIPTAPTPFDSPSTGTACTEARNSYTYAAWSDNTSYTIYYCLGADTGGLSGGPRTATPSGL